MSRYTISPRQKHNHLNATLTVGWDKQMKTFFAKYIPNEDPILLANGITSLEKLVEIVHPWAIIPPNTLIKLDEDKKTSEQPSPLQKKMMDLITKAESDLLAEEAEKILTPTAIAYAVAEYGVTEKDAEKIVLLQKLHENIEALMLTDTIQLPPHIVSLLKLTKITAEEIEKAVPTTD